MKAVFAMLIGMVIGYVVAQKPKPSWSISSTWPMEPMRPTGGQVDVSRPWISTTPPPHIYYGPLPDTMHSAGTGKPPKSDARL